MTTIHLPLRESQTARRPRLPTVALVGNPNAGKTTLFNALTGLRAKTANFPGTTIEHRTARIGLPGGPVELLDLPGLYSLDATTPDERVAERALRGTLPPYDAPDAVLLVLDATHLERNLFLAGRVLELGRPAVVALNMMDLAQRAGISIDLDALSRELGCPVVPVVARRTGRGVEQLRAALDAALDAPPNPAKGDEICACTACGQCPYAARYDWAGQVADRCGVRPLETHGRVTEAIDRVLTHPIVGVAAFLSVMAVVFITIFFLADYPMSWIEQGFALAGDAVATAVPAGDLRSLLVDGLIGGVGGVLVFLPQIVILFFFITLLEDTGYLARAAFVMDRLMRRFGLPGRAFVPMLSAHACAIPGIMATRVIEDPRDRLVTILILPLMTCSARLPVYAMVIALLFPHQPVKAGLLFTGAYMLGIFAALGVSLLLRRTVVPGRSQPLVIELPGYKLPSLRNALLATWDRAMIFVKKAGTVILLISIVLWAAATYPKMPADRVQAGTDAESIARQQLEYSVAGRLGKAVEPVFRPLGFDWQINVGVVSSFAAREVIVSTLAIVYGVGEDAAEDEATLTETLHRQTRPDGSPVFSTAACLSLLVFYVLAMQCLPTQVVTRRETGKWRWALFQLGYMTALAYGGALVTYQAAVLFGAG